MALFPKRKHHTAGQVDKSRLPRHIAIIMDGNGRWAQKRGLPRTAGHKAGAAAFRDIAAYCKELGLEYLTVYAFSTENWKRPKDEVDAIMSLLEQYLQEAIDSMETEQIRLEFFGDTTVLSKKLQQMIARAREISRRCSSGCQANICLNYGGRSEILRAARLCAQQGEAWTEEAFSRCLYSADIPDPELIIRPSGELRLSNFLLWQCAYSEFYFTDTLWPDFGRRQLDRALIAYQRRDRRFGGVKK